MQQILDAVLVAWSGTAGASGPGSGEAAAAATATFVECWTFAVSQAVGHRRPFDPHCAAVWGRAICVRVKLDRQGKCQGAP